MRVLILYTLANLSYGNSFDLNAFNFLFLMVVMWLKLLSTTRPVLMHSGLSNNIFRHVRQTVMKPFPHAFNVRGLWIFMPFSPFLNDIIIPYSCPVAFSHDSRAHLFILTLICRASALMISFPNGKAHMMSYWQSIYTFLSAAYT